MAVSTDSKHVHCASQFIGTSVKKKFKAKLILYGIMSHIEIYFKHLFELLLWFASDENPKLKTANSYMKGFLINSFNILYRRRTEKWLNGPKFSLLICACVCNYPGIAMLDWIENFQALNIWTQISFRNLLYLPV